MDQVEALFPPLALGAGEGGVLAAGIFPLSVRESLGWIPLFQMPVPVIEPFR